MWLQSTVSWMSGSSADTFSKYGCERALIVESLPEVYYDNLQAFVLVLILHNAIRI